MSNDIKSLFKIGSTISLLLLTMSTLIVANNSSTGFESSIYTTTATIFWISIFINFFLGILISFYSINNELDKHCMLLGTLLTVFSSIVVLALPIIKGYFLWNFTCDPAVHFKYIQYILKTGFFEQLNFYPILHIYASEILIILNISVNKISWILPLIFETLNFLFIYILAKSILNDDKKSILVTILSTTLPLGWYITFTPNHLCNLFFPLVLMILIKCLLVKNDRIPWTILLLIMIFLIPPFHPVVGTALLLITISLLIFTFLDKYLDVKSAINISLTLILLVGVWTITWISSFFIWERTLTNIHTLITEGGPTAISKLSDQAAYASGLGYNVFEHALKTYGTNLFFLIITILAFLIIWKARKDERMKNLLMLYSPIIVMSITTIAFYFLNLFGPTRYLVYIVYFTLIISGFYIYKFMKNVKNHKTIITSVSAILILVLFINGTFTVYPSDYTLQTSRQSTKSELMGITWFLYNMDVENHFSSITTDPTKMIRYCGLKNIRLHKEEVPYHFGYNNSTSLAESYNRTSYLIITEKDKQFYVDVFPNLAKDRWAPNDFVKLNYDRNLGKLYTNGEFDTWLVTKD